MQWPLRRCLKTKYNTLSVSIDLLTPEIELIQVHVKRYSNTDCNQMPRCLTLPNDYTVVF